MCIIKTSQLNESLEGLAHSSHTKHFRIYKRCCQSYTNLLCSSSVRRRRSSGPCPRRICNPPSTVLLSESARAIFHFSALACPVFGRHSLFLCRLFELKINYRFKIIKNQARMILPPLILAYVFFLTQKVEKGQSTMNLSE